MQRLVNGVPVDMTTDEIDALATDAASQAAAGLVLWRESATITDLQFAAAAMLPQFGFMTEQEAADWVGAGVIPAVAQAVIDGIADPTERAVATIRIRGARTISRNESFVSALASAYGLTDEEVDAFFVVARGLF